MNRVRLLPIVIFAALALLVFKGIGIVTNGGYVLTGTTVAVAQAGEDSAAQPSDAVVGDTSPIRDLTFVEDTAAAFLSAGSAELEFGHAYNAGSQRAVTISDVLDLVLELSGSNKPVRRDERRLRPQNSEVRALLADSSRLERATGWRAQTDLREGLKRTIAWWRARLSQGLVRHEMGYMT